MKKRTIARTVSRSGIQMHQGGENTVTLKPASAGEGIVLRRTDVPAGTGDFFLREQGETLVQPTPLATILKNATGTTISTLEHLLAALAGLNISDIIIELAGPEVPIMDGSAQPWVAALDEAGLVWLEDEAVPLVVSADFLQQDDKGRKAQARPAAAGWQITVRIDFDHPKIGAQECSGLVTEDFFRKEIAPARSFVMEKDLKTLLSWGLMKGATLAGGVLFGLDGTVTNPEGLRYPDEPIRHKFLDAMGDLYLRGQPWAGAFDFTTPGHAATNLFLREVLAGTAAKLTAAAEGL